MLVKCLDCGSPVSTHSGWCPVCGCKKIITGHSEGLSGGGMILLGLALLGVFLIFITKGEFAVWVGKLFGL